MFCKQGQHLDSITRESTYDIALGVTDDEELAVIGLRRKDANTSGDVFSVQLGIVKASVWELDVADVVLDTARVCVSKAVMREDCRRTPW